ncbi:lithostathine-like [Budorcas taxicolor]|uniref:lithostathine-like n=1 Tax=Budorcas taxicolor TaxID=37181 RepID=UPI00228367AB|nr:lithostathine-like [Budorcas taxicolor]
MDTMLPSLGLPRLSCMLLCCLMLLSQVQGQEPNIKLLSERISCPRGSIGYGSYCYALYKAARSWMGANIACQKRPSGHLASVLSGTEGAFLASLVRDNLNTQSDVWIGLHDPTEGTEPNAGGWEWSSTDVLNYFAWERSPATVSNPGHCGILSRTSGYLKWKDYSCHVNLPYICKFKG